MAKASEEATYVPNREEAFTLLWLLSLGNMAIGFVFWIWNTVALEFVGLEYASEELEAILWREIGSGFFSFGLLVLVVALATGAIVSAIDEGLAKPKGRSKE
jgi:hypothetical protein